MKTKSKRILSLVLALCLCLTMLPEVTMQAEAASNIVINGVDIGYANGSYFTKNGRACTSTYFSNGRCHKNGVCDDASSSKCNCMRYWPTGSPSTCQVDLLASQCFGFARYCQWRVYGYHDGNSSGKFTDLTGKVSASNCTATYLKSKLLNCAPATHLRTGDGGHSISIVSATDYGVNLTDCNSDGYCKVRYWTYSWAQLATYLSGRGGLSYAKSANEGAGAVHTTHTYTGSYHDAAHPHKAYQMCSCGATRYTGGTTYVSTCDTCNPVSTSSKYNAVLSFKGYLKGTSKVYPYSTAQLASTTGGEIWSTDECTISAIYSNGACKVTYPAGTTTKTAYTSLSNFIGDTSAALTRQTVNHQVTTYVRASTGSTVYGYISAGDVIYKLGTSGSMTQIFYPTSSGYKLAWVLTSELTEPTYDTRFNPYCPIKGYPCATANFIVYGSDHATSYGTVFTSDYCTINAVYADGWCQVTYPVSGGTKTAYTPLSNFVYNVSATHVKYTAKSQTTVYTTKSLGSNPGWYISAGDVFYVVSTYGSASQVLYPIDAQYGGGYKLGWVYTSALPKTTYTVSYNANGGSNAPSSQTKTHGTALTLSTAVPTRTGYAFVGWATSATATAATYAPGASYTTDAKLTLYAVWTLNKYEIAYNANGGTNAPATQNKAYGTNLTLSTGVPAKYYTVTFNANGGTVDVSSRQVASDFLGWATSASASSPTYQPGGTFTTNANTTLYAVWKNPTLTQYVLPVREGYVFDGWYTAASGGTQVTLSTVVSSNMTLYAHWVVATYGISYDANGGTGVPTGQTKNHGKALTLSTTVPTRENYTFLGWATEENPATVQFHPGDTYSVDSDIMLIAVWRCDLNPAIDVGSVSGKPGEIVTVPIRISDNPGIIAARLKISYNSDVLTLTGVKDGGILGEYNFGDDLTASPYIVSWSNGTAKADYTATGNLVYLTFKIADDAKAGSSAVSVTYNANEVYNVDLANVNLAVTNGVVTVEEKAEEYTPVIRVDSVNVAPGETFTVEVSTEEAQLGTVSAVVEFDPEILRLDSVDSTEFEYMTSNISKGSVSIACIASGVVTDGTLAQLTFTVLATEETSTELIIKEYEATDADDNSVPMNVIDGAITISTYLLGDVNQDGKVTAVDSRWTLQSVVGGRTLTATQLLAADVNHDGKVTAVDARWILQSVVGARELK